MCLIKSKSFFLLPTPKGTNVTRHSFRLPLKSANKPLTLVLPLSALPEESRKRQLIGEEFYSGSNPNAPEQNQVLPTVFGGEPPISSLVLELQPETADARSADIPAVITTAELPPLLPVSECNQLVYTSADLVGHSAVVLPEDLVKREIGADTSINGQDHSGSLAPQLTGKSADYLRIN